jgi:hypothetical protein
MTKIKLGLAAAVAAVLTFGVAACGPQAEPTTEDVTMSAPEVAPEVDTPAPEVAPVDPATVPAEGQTPPPAQ